MIAILQNADFSNDNVGQVTLPESLHEFTRRIFERCTRFGVNSEQAQIVNKFVKILDAQGLIEHLGFFAAPWLSANLNEALFDIITDTQLSSSNHVYSGDGKIAATEASAYISLQNELKAKNFFGSITWGSGDRSPVWVGPSGYKRLFIFKGYASNGSSLAFQLNPNAGMGYTIPASAATEYQFAKHLVFNITELADMEQGNTTINGNNVIVSGAYTKSTHEPYVDRITTIATAYNLDPRRLIMFAGDGTNLNNTQIVALNNGLSALYQELTSLETN